MGVTPDEAKEGYVSLFDGKTLLAWFGDIRHYAVENGLMVCHGGDVYVHKPYANFILRFDFRLPPGGNNGVAIARPAKATRPMWAWKSKSSTMGTRCTRK